MCVKVPNGKPINKETYEKVKKNKLHTDKDKQNVLKRTQVLNASLIEQTKHLFLPACDL